MKRKKRFLRNISLALAMAVTISMLPSFSAFAEGDETSVSENQKWTPDIEESSINYEGDLSLDQLATKVLSEEDKPEVISDETIAEKGHVNRLWAQESDLNAIIFQNKDGKKTMYFFAEPVKYIDKDGKVKDKKSNVTDLIDKSEYQTDYGYVNANNDIKTYFPKNFNKDKGILLEKDKTKIEVSPFSSTGKEIVPSSDVLQDNFVVNEDSSLSRTDYVQKDAVSAVPSKKQFQDENHKQKDAIEYDKVFGTDTLLRYTPTFSGFKEDIILNKNTDVNEFSFKVKTYGLSLVSEEGSYYLANPLTGEKVASIGDISVYDSKPIPDATKVIENSSQPPQKPEQPKLTEEEMQQLYFPEQAEQEPMYKHYYRVETTAQDQEYILTLVVDESYLNAEDTVYPVTIDPSIKIETNNRIEDATIYSNYSVNDGGNQYLYAGYQGSMGFGRALVRFPGLFTNSTLNSISSSRIDSVEYIPTELHRGAALWIDAYAVTRGWSQYGVKCDSLIWNATGEFLDDAYMYPGGGTDSDGNSGTTKPKNWYPFDITDLFKDWRNGAYGGIANHYGIMLKAYIESGTALAQLGSAQHATLFPSVMVEYDTTIPVSQVCLSPSSVTLRVNDTYYLAGSVAPSNATNQTIYYTSSNPNVASVGYYSGMICASDAGTTTITARSAADSSKYATCTVKVRYPLGALEYQGHMYPIFVPDHLNTTPTTEQWTVFDEFLKTDVKFGFLDFLTGTEFDDDILGNNAVYPGNRVDMPAIQSSSNSLPLGLGAVFVGILNSVSENISTYFIKATFQTSNLGNRRVIISVGCSVYEELMEQYADGIPRSGQAQNAGSPSVQALISVAVAGLYEEITGNPSDSNPLIFYDFEVTADSKHRNDEGTSSYLWFDENGTIMEAPIIYPMDKVRLGTTVLSYFNFTPFYTVPLSGSREALPQYQNLFGSIY